MVHPPRAPGVVEKALPLVGKTHHHCVVIDESGRRLLSRRLANDETDAKDAAVIAGQVRVRRDLHPITRRRRHRHRPQTPHRSAHGPGRRPHPHGQPSASPPHERLPRPGTGAEPHQHRPAHPADRLPDPRGHPPYRRQASSDLAAQPSRRPRRPARRDRRPGGRTAAHHSATDPTGSPPLGARRRNVPRWVPSAASRTPSRRGHCPMRCSGEAQFAPTAAQPACPDGVRVAPAGRPDASAARAGRR